MLKARMLLQRIKRGKDQVKEMDRPTTPNQSKFLVYGLLVGLGIIAVATRYLLRKQRGDSLDMKRVDMKMQQNQREAREEANKIWLEMIEKGEMYVIQEKGTQQS